MIFEYRSGWGIVTDATNNYLRDEGMGKEYGMHKCAMTAAMRHSDVL